MNKIKKAVKYFSAQAEKHEEGSEDVAMWEHIGHIESALDAKTEKEAMDILEDAIGAVNWNCFTD